jgi:hypothetical protein
MSTIPAISFVFGSNGPTKMRMLKSDRTEIATMNSS